MRVFGCAAVVVVRATGDKGILIADATESAYLCSADLATVQPNDSRKSDSSHSTPNERRADFV